MNVQRVTTLLAGLTLVAACAADNRETPTSVSVSLARTCGDRSDLLVYRDAPAPLIEVRVGVEMPPTAPAHTARCLAETVLGRVSVGAIDVSQRGLSVEVPIDARAFARLSASRNKTGCWAVVVCNDADGDGACGDPNDDLSLGAGAGTIETIPSLPSMRVGLRVSPEKPETLPTACDGYASEFATP